MTIKEETVEKNPPSALTVEDVLPLPVTSDDAIPMVQAIPWSVDSLREVAMPAPEPIQPSNSVRVLAPRTLPEGATFKAVVNGKEFVATVPRGGVREGEVFETAYPSFSPQPTNTTVMSQSGPKWRTGLFDGCSCDLCCMACCCALVVYGQIIQRLNLTLGGCRKNQMTQPCEAPIGACVLLPSITIGLFVPLFVFASMEYYFGTGLLAYGIIGWNIFIFIAMVCTRKSMREQYELEGACCAGGGCVDDFCVTSWCAPCSAMQMARQTHDPRVYHYHCCSPTGLGPDAPPCDEV